MSDFQIARNLGSMFESATRSFNKNIDTSNVGLPPSVTSFINTNYYNVETEFTTEEITRALNSNNDKEIYAIMKYLVNKLTTKFTPSSENDLLQLFPFVIKNVNSSNYKIKRLVYIFLLKFNHLKQDVALLSINAIQRSLMDKDCINRSLAIRCLSGIKIPAILPILLLSLEKSIKDSSPLVRSAAAISILKCVNLDTEYHKTGSINQRDYIINSLKNPSSTISQLYYYLDILLSDNDSKVLSVSLLVFQSAFMGFWDIFHNKITNLINHIEDLDSFAISLLLDMLTDYSKCYFPPFEDLKSGPPDLQSLYEHCQSFIYSPDSNVVLSLIRFLSNTMPFTLNDFQIERLLLKFINLSDESTKVLFLNETEYLLSRNLIKIENNQLNHFYPLKRENLNCFKSKINILFSLINSENFNQIFKLLKQCIEISTTLNKLIILRNLNILILNKDLQDDQLNSLIKFFMSNLQSDKSKSNKNNNNIKTEHDDDEEQLISEYITGMRQLIQTNLSGYVEIIIKLVGKLYQDSKLTNNARGSIIWLIGEFVINVKPSSEGVLIGTLMNFIPNICQFLAKEFPNEGDYHVKIQMLTCIGKIIIMNINNNREEYLNTIKNNQLFKIWNYMLQLAKVDTNLELRDQARFLGSLLPNVVYPPCENFNSRDQWDINDLVDANWDRLVNQCAEVDVGLLMYQINKFKKQETNSFLGGDNIISPIIKFNQVSKNELEQGYLSYYDNLRTTGFELKDYNKYAKGISSATFDKRIRSSSLHESISASSTSPSTPIGSASALAGGGSSIFKSKKTNQYKLQTLDDFLAS